MRHSIVLCALVALFPAPILAEGLPDPWVITGNETITEPMEVGDVIVAQSGSLVVDGVPAPGFVLSGNLWAIDDAVVQLRDSVIRFASTYHGQYTLVGIDRARVVVEGCDYRVTEGIQHGLVVSGDATLGIRQSQFNSIQLVAGGAASLAAEATDGFFEIILQDSAVIALEDIPRTPDAGSLWVWVEIPSGGRVSYSPPMTGMVDSWSFPPANAAGIPSRCQLTRCHVQLWPMLVWNDSTLELRDIAEDNWVVVGLHLPTSTAIRGLSNGLSAVDTTLPLEDHPIRLINASVDTWNLYAWNDAEIEIRDSHLGEILAFEDSHVIVRHSLIDGTGGYLGTTDRSVMELWGSTTTCTVQAVGESTLEMHGCTALPYPNDPTGDWTRFGAYDSARLLADHTPVETTPALGGAGVIAVTWIANPIPRLPSVPIDLHGTLALFGLEEAPTMASWQLWERPGRTGSPRLLEEGFANIEQDLLATWMPAIDGQRHRLEMVIVDSEGRAVRGVRTVPDRQPRRLPEAASAP